MEEIQRDELIKWGIPEEEIEEEERAKVEIWKYIFGFVEMAVVKCAIELGIADVIATHGRPMTLLELSSALDCDPQNLHRIMRFLVNRAIFKEILIRNDAVPTAYYAQTPISRRLMRTGENSMAAFILLESSPPMLAPWHGLSARVMARGTSAFEAAHGEDIWKYAEANPGHARLIDEAMACDARVAVPAIIDGCSDVFDGVRTLVDVGGGNGTALRMLVKGCPWISKGINFDLPHVASVAEKCEGIEHVGGLEVFGRKCTASRKDFVVHFEDEWCSLDNAIKEIQHGGNNVKEEVFECISPIGVSNSLELSELFIVWWVLHDWADDECIHILKKCRAAIPKDIGKVIIAEAVIGNKEQQKEDNKLKDVGLVLDMVMMAHTTKGKERTLDEWAYVIREAGFSRHTVRSIAAVQSVIEAFPA
ncbi:3'-hydroxy-N-methyl-(S)-coclaurine 4'-O-methyltransferase [Morus notabilis]|uniref:3'-hydroxy-N-methyl-(S)-coclaurine 4'-O-methyltransferase n=1 Tax=Morus notabilis TaxID=981085 RepID=W9RUF2_9ROSA|nr:3'-hydroxy-N-methyl-(S)-coclaurine 4'-O-methyltransferase [Morus notabilis]